MNIKNMSIMLAAVMGMSVLFTDVSWLGALSSLAATKAWNETEDAKASSSNMPKEEQEEKGRSADTYPILDISEDKAIIDTAGKYIIQQTDGMAYNIYINENCELWLDGLNGDAKIEISDMVTSVKIHLLNDCTIGGFDDTKASAYYLFDSSNLQGESTELYTLIGANGDLQLPGNGTIEANHINFEGNLFSRSYWDVYAGVYKYGASDLKMIGGSVNGNISFTKLYKNTDATSTVKPYGTIEFTDVKLNMQNMEAGTAGFKDCVVTSGEEAAYVMASLIQTDNLQWTSESDITFETKGNIKNSKFICTDFYIENSYLTFEATSVEATRYIMMNPTGTWEDRICNIEWKNCFLKADSMDISNAENIGSSVIFDSCNVEINSGITADASEAMENAPGLVNLEIKNKSKFSVKSDEWAMLLYGNTKATITDSEVILDGQTSALSGHGIEFEGKGYDPQLILGKNTAIKNNGVYELINHIPRIANSVTKKEMKYAEIGKAQTSGKNYDDAFPLPTFSGNKRVDMITVAQSQLGYAQSDTGETVYADWAGQPSRPWCSEFASWCANKAGISKQIFPVGTSSKKFKEFYEARGRYYVMDGGCTPEGTDSKIIEITLPELQPGDLLLTESSGNYSDGPDHIAIFLGLKNGYVECIAGNVGGEVAMSYKSVEEIHGVCKPDYEKVISGGGSSGGGSSGGGVTSGVLSGKVQIQITSDSTYGGSWESSGSSWRLKKEDGTYAAGQWGMVDGKWYLFNQAGYMADGWQQVNQTWYYLGINGDMAIGWQNIDGKWYYFSTVDTGTQGSMLSDTTTPDGYTVSADGVWIP